MGKWGYGLNPSLVSERRRIRSAWAKVGRGLTLSTLADCTRHVLCSPVVPFYHFFGGGFPY